MKVPENNASEQVKAWLQRTPLSSIMTENPVTVEVDDSFSLVEEKMRAHAIRHLPVLDMVGKLVGIITERDLYRIRSPRVRPDGTEYYVKENLDGYILSHCMTKNPFTLNPESTLADVILIIAEKKYGCVPIVDETGILKGIVTRIDIIRCAAELI